MGNFWFENGTILVVFSFRNFQVVMVGNGTIPGSVPFPYSLTLTPSNLRTYILIFNYRVYLFTFPIQ
jgi:hypothetical protein